MCLDSYILLEQFVLIYKANNIQDPWEIFEETVINSGQALGYNPDDGLSDKWELDSDKESLYPIICKNNLPYQRPN
ncbi:6928_t:CDS:2 [Gigaspora margarita]|uniref:6928_t:CDS:1 n=1 Tax=Gigaspora margarita TaxID=4874 RepID=A0ABM8VVP6_GIGMA|nr:6928_t:CDS:2 [Gigaspora margarita]